MTTTQVEYLDQPDAGRYIAVENGQWWMVDGHSSIRIESNKWLWVCDRIGWQQKFKHTLDAIEDYHDELMHPDEITWGSMTPEMADNIYNQYGDYDENISDEWGTHALNMLIAIGMEKW
tara:strand:+ start:667 stop:1023 length:357 start_codon:yes stop_codon:yes gene_type:complete